MFPTRQVIELVVLLLVTIAAAYFPPLAETFKELGGLIVIILAFFLGLPAAVQALAMKYNYELRGGQWSKVRS